jgi:hypothetical protein
MVLAGPVQDAADTVCIVPDEYHFTMRVNQATGGQVHISLPAAYEASSDVQQFVAMVGVTVDSDRFPRCVAADSVRDTNTVIVRIPAPVPSYVALYDGVLHVWRNDCRALGQVAAFDMWGRPVFQTRCSTSREDADLGALAAGVYMVRIGSGAEMEMAKVVR